MTSLADMRIALDYYNVEIGIQERTIEEWSLLGSESAGLEQRLRKLRTERKAIEDELLLAVFALGGAALQRKAES